MKLTDAQIQELWEMVGFKVAARGTRHGDGTWIRRDRDAYLYPNKHGGKQPALDLNNLNKWVFPKLHYVAFSQMWANHPAVPIDCKGCAMLQPNGEAFYGVDPDLINAISVACYKALKDMEEKL